MVAVRFTTPLRVPSRRRRPRREPIVPMINVVFLLLVFFLLTAQFSDPTPGASQDIPVPSETVLLQDSLILTPTGLLLYRDLQGRDAMLSAVAAGPVRLELEAATAARTLARLLTDLALAGADNVDLIVRDRSIPR